MTFRKTNIVARGAFAERCLHRPLLLDLDNTSVRKHEFSVSWHFIANGFRNCLTGADDAPFMALSAFLLQFVDSFPMHYP